MDTVMRPDALRPTRLQHLVNYSQQRMESFLDQPLRNISHAAKELAQGHVIAWKMYTVGLIVDGTNPEALKGLFAAKSIPYEKALRGERPVVSVLPPREYRGDIIDIDKHHPDIQAVLQGDDKNLLTPDGHALFYRVFAKNAPHLQPPLVAEDRATQAHTIVFVWHDNKFVRQFEQKAREYKFKHARRGEEQIYLLTGSSANPTGEKQPMLRSHLDPSVARHVKTTVDVQDRRVHRMQPEERGVIPMIDLTCYPPKVIREGMYPAVPADPILQALLNPEPQPGAPQKAA